jgi:hypothetical protein
MVEEIFGMKSRGAPPKGWGFIKNFELLPHINEIHRMRIEDGYPSDVTEAALDLPALFKVLQKNGGIGEEIAQRYQKTKVETLKRYVHTALTEGADLLQTAPQDLDPTLAEILKEALDNFRPGWRQNGKR